VDFTLPFLDAKIVGLCGTNGLSYHKNYIIAPLIFQAQSAPSGIQKKVLPYAFKYDNLNPTKRE
jgi:hypothetical protein